MRSTSMGRLVRSFVLDIRAPLEAVFPLLCPEREKEWMPGWDARMIHSASGLAERGAVFESPHDAGRTLWIITEYDAPRRIAFARWQSDGLVVHLEIALARQHEGSTALCVSYTYTAADQKGVAALAALGEDVWLKTMAFWKECMHSWFETHPPAAAAS